MRECLYGSVELTREPTRCIFPGPLHLIGELRSRPIGVLRHRALDRSLEPLSEPSLDVAECRLNPLHRFCFLALDLLAQLAVATS